jgi:hypothetical protein
MNMKMYAYFLSLMMLIVPLTGCTGSEEMDFAEKFEIDSGIMNSSRPTTFTYFPEYEDNQEHTVNALMRDMNYTYEEAMEFCRCNSTHRDIWSHTPPEKNEEGVWVYTNASLGVEYNKTWSDYDRYGWEVTLISGEGTWDVLWYDWEGMVRWNRDSDFRNNSSSVLDIRGMNDSGFMGPLEGPEQKCSGVEEDDWMTPYGFQSNCPFRLENDWHDHYLFWINILDQSDDFLLEWTVFGWK